MAGLTPGRIYFIESEAAQQDWITNNAGDPDAIVIGNFTEGLHYCSITIPEGFSISGFTGAIVTPSGAGKSFDLRNAKRFFKAINQGISTSLANINLVNKFIFSDRHVSGSGTVFKRYHMIVYFGTNLHFEFTDAADNRVSYCTGIIISAISKFTDVQTLIFRIYINWDSVW